MTSYLGEDLLGGVVADAPPVAPAFAPPQILVEAAFGANPDDTAPTWTLIHDSYDLKDSYVRSLHYRRGRANQLSRFDTGTADILLKNADRAWDPQNTHAPFWPHVKPMLMFRARAVHQGVTYWLTKQFANGFPRRRIGPYYAEAQVSLSDGMKRYAKNRIPPGRATLTAVLTGLNNDLVYTAKNPGPEGNDISVVYFKTHFRPLRHQFVVVTVLDKQIRVDFIDDGTPEAHDILDAVTLEPSAAQLVTVENAPGNDGNGTAFEFDEAHLAGGDTLPFPQELGGARINRCLDLGKWPTAQRDIATGQDMQAAMAFPTQEIGRLLTHMQDVAGPSAEDGVLFIDGRGYWKFLDRRAKLESPFNLPVATFSDTPIVGEFPYVDASPSIDDDMVLNDVVVTRDGGVAQSAFDADSALTFGVSSQSFTSTLATDVDCAAAAQMIVATYAQPLQRISTIKLMPAVDPDMWTVVLGLELGQRIQIKELPPGGGFANIADYIIQGLDWTFPPGPLQGAVLTLDLWPADPLQNWFALDDPVRGVLDGDNRLDR